MVGAAVVVVVVVVVGAAVVVVGATVVVVTATVVVGGAVVVDPSTGTVVGAGVPRVVGVDAAGCSAAVVVEVEVVELGWSATDTTGSVSTESPPSEQAAAPRLRATSTNAKRDPTLPHRRFTGSLEPHPTAAVRNFETSCFVVFDVDRIHQLLRRPGLWIGVAVAVGLGVIAPEIYTGTVSDIDTAARVVMLVAIVALWVVAARRFVAQPLARAVLVWGPIGIMVATLVWPYVRPATEVDEAFPPAATVIVETTTTTIPPTTTTVPQEPSADAAPTTSTTTTTTTTTTVPPEPVELRRSSFQGLTGHRGDGDAAVYRLPDQSILLRFEEVDIGSGPALEVYLVPGEDRRDLGDAVYVAPLTAERGNQNYTVPADVDLTDGTWTVLVWCETFSVEVANATLA